LLSSDLIFKGYRSRKTSTVYKAM